MPDTHLSVELELAINYIFLPESIFLYPNG